MKRWLLSLIAASLGGAAGVSAYDMSCDPCCPSRASWFSCCGSFEVGAELLYLRPCLCDLDYAINDERVVAEIGPDSLPRGEQLTLRPNYRAGFRVFVGYISECSCYDARVQYTWHHPTRHGRFSPINDRDYWPTYGHPLDLNVSMYNGNGRPVTDVRALTKANAKFDYDAIDLQVGHRRCKCNLWSRIFCGLHWFNLDHHFRAFYKGSFVTFPGVESEGNLRAHVDTSRCVWAIGPQIGIEGTYMVACGFGVGGRVWAGALAGRTRGRFDEHDIVSFVAAENDRDVFLDVDHRSRCVVIPVIDARLGVNYTWCCNRCLTLVIEFGYEFLTYINAVHRQVFNDKGGTASTNCQSYDLDGFYLSFRLTI